MAAIVLVIVGCSSILLPFIPAILFAVVVCISTWPLYVRLRGTLQGKSTPAALIDSFRFKQRKKFELQFK